MGLWATIGIASVGSRANGHVDVGHTYWYIEAVPELLQLATERLVGHQPGGER